jgi:two-component system cell cycle sensor histidine kinase/response regulator CckA
VSEVPDPSLYEASFELHPDALLLTAEDFVRAVNAQAEILFGYSREEWIGQRLDHVLPNDTSAPVGRRKDGSSFPAEIVQRRLPDSTVLYVVRVATEIGASEQALLDARQLHQDVINSAQVGLLVLNRDLHYVAWNPRMEQISGLRAEEVLGKDPLVLFPFLKTVGADRLWQRALAGETANSSDFPFEVPPHGRKGWTSQTVGPLRNSKGDIIGVIVSVIDITARKQAEEALRESEERFRGLVESSPMPMLMAAGRERVLLLNRSFIDLFGYTTADIPDFASWEERAYPNAEYRREIRETWRRALEDGDRTGRTSFGPVEALITCRDGGVRFVEVHLCRQSDFSLIIFHDLTQRIAAEEAVRENEARLRRIVETLPVMIAALDESGAFISWNRECERVTGYSATEMIGNPNGFALLFPNERDRQQADMVRGSADASANPWQITRKDGVKRMVRWYRVSSQLPVPGWARWGVGIDVTEHFRLEEQLRQAQKMQAVGQLAGGVAHDFNNLLTVILGYSDLILQRMPQSDRHYEMVAGVRNAGGRAAKLVKQLLLFSRKAVAHAQKLDLRELLAQTLGMLRRLIDEDIAISCTCAADLGGIEADAGQMEQVVMNLCLNARDAMPAGGAITLSAENVTFRDEDCAATDCRPGEFVRLSVKDTGCGMPPEVRAHLFEPFFTTKPPGGGTGLGLATVYAIVQQARGFLLVESEPGKGTTIQVCLPRVEPPRAAGLLPEIAPAHRRGGETILLVEDDDPVRQITALFLESNGYRVLQADSGAAALRLAAEHEAPIHLLLSDVVMPEMGGGELARRMVTVRPNTKILFMSGYNEDDMVNRGLKPSNLLQKPFTEEELVGKIRETLERKT